MIEHKPHLLAWVCAALIVSGCSATGGSTEFSCPDPEHGVCMSATSVYAATEEADYVEGPGPDAKKPVDNTAFDEFNEEGYAPGPEEATAAATRTRAGCATASCKIRKDNTGKATITVNARPVPAPVWTDPMPVREPARLMRIWVAPWEDERGNLMVSSYVYTEIEARRWSIGLVDAVPTARRFTPLDIDKASPRNDSANHSAPLNPRNANRR